jgi:hypothetical protein
VRNLSYIAIVCGVVLAVPGCGRTKIAAPDVQTDNFKDSQYYQSLMGLSAVTTYGNFLNSLGPADRVKYINKSVEEGPPTRIFALKPAYERFVNDANPEVAAAAKEALSKVPSAEELEAAKKEDLEKLKPKQ